MQINFKIVYLKTKTLKFNQHNLKADGDPRENENYSEFRQTVKICGIQQPFKIKKDGTTLRSGNMRLAAALDENVEEVPCIIEDYGDEINNTTSHKERHQIIDDYKTVVHDTKKAETPYSKHLRIKIIEAYYGIKQGMRSDKSPEIKKAKKERDKIAPQTERTQLNAIQKNLDVIYPNNPGKQKEYWDEVGTKKSVVNAVKETKMLAVKAKEKESLKDRFDYITDYINIYNQSCLNMAHIPDKSVKAVIGSPPYHLMKPPQPGVEDELGQEKPANQYAVNLLNHYLPCKRILLDNGVIYVVINEGIKDGSYTGAVEWFIVLMLQNGFYLNDILIWAKYNTQPSGGGRSTRNFEYILQFALNPAPKSDFTWLNEFEQLKDNIFGTGHGIKLASFIHLKEGFVKTSVANTTRLREACEKAGFYLDHSSTYPPEIPFVCIKNSCQKGDHIVDLFNGCGNTAKAVLYANMGITYHGFEINPLSVRASKINIEMDFGKQPKDNTIPFTPNQDNSTQQVA